MTGSGTHADAEPRDPIHALRSRQGLDLEEEPRALPQALRALPGEIGEALVLLHEGDVRRHPQHEERREHHGHRADEKDATAHGSTALPSIRRQTAITAHVTSHTVVMRTRRLYRPPQLHDTWVRCGGVRVPVAPARGARAAERLICTGWLRKAVSPSMKICSHDARGSLEHAWRTLRVHSGSRGAVDVFMQAAIDEARQGLAEGGIPIGSVLVRDGHILARGHNRRVQHGNPILHAEIDCLQRAGRVGSYRGTVLYSTLMPCHLCAGAAVQFRIPKVVVGESRTFAGARGHMEASGVEVVDLDLDECAALMEAFIREHPTLWNEDIGEL